MINRIGRRRGSAHPNAVLTERRVQVLRMLHEDRGYSASECAAYAARWRADGAPWDLGNMHRILTRKAWRHVP